MEVLHYLAAIQENRIHTLSNTFSQLSHQLLEASALLRSQHVSLSNYWYYVDLLMKLTHELNVNLTKTNKIMRKSSKQKCSIEMTKICNFLF